MTEGLTRSRAILFIVLLGIVSLFADMTYEGARSITGPYLAVLGANAAIVGVVAGLGELIGYSLRLVSGYLADRTRRYWMLTIIGYTVNLLAVPLLALTHHWPVAAVLMVMERLGKSIRVPPRDAMLSQAANKIGMGWGFGLHQALDQIGAMLGPFIVALVLFLKGGYREGFAVLAIPALLALMMLVIAYRRYPTPEHLEITIPKIKTKIAQKTFWLYLIGVGFVAAGFADFPLIAYHFEKSKIFDNTWIPIIYGVAMGIDAVFSLFVGKLYDKYGLLVLSIVIACAAFFAPLVFLGGFTLAFIGVGLWGIGMGTHASLMRAIVGNMIPADKRGSAYGIFNMVYGVFWFIGSVAIGVIYDYSILSVVIFIMVLEFLALPWFYVVMKKLAKN